MFSFNFATFVRNLVSSDWGVTVPVVTGNSFEALENTKSLVNQYNLAKSIELRLWSQVTPEESLSCLNLIERIIKKNLGFCAGQEENLSGSVSKLLENCAKIVLLWFEFFEMQREFLATKTQTDDISALQERLSAVFEDILYVKRKIAKLKSTLLSAPRQPRYSFSFANGEKMLFSLSATPPLESFKFWRKLTRVLSEGYPDFSIDVYDSTGMLEKSWQASEWKMSACTVRFPEVSSLASPFPIKAYTRISKALWQLLKLHSQRFDNENIELKSVCAPLFDSVVQLLLSKKNVKVTWINVLSLLNAAKELSIDSLQSYLSTWLVTRFDSYDPSNEEFYEKAKAWYPISSLHPLPELKTGLTRFFNRRLQSSFGERGSLEYFDNCIEDFKRLSIEEVDLRQAEQFRYQIDATYLIKIATISSLRKLYLGKYPIIDDDLAPLTALRQLGHLEALDCRLLETDGVKILSQMTTLTSLSLLKLIKLQNSDFTLLSRLPLKQASFLEPSFSHLESLRLLTQLEMLTLTKTSSLQESVLENLSHIATLRTLVLDGISDCNSFYEIRKIPSLTELHLWECSGAPRNSIHNLATTNLRKLTLYGNSLYDPGINDLNLLGNLESLSLSCAVTTLGSLYSLNKLTELNLSGCHGLSDNSLEHLSSLTALNRLRLINCPRVSEASLVAISKMSGLTMLDLRRSSFSLEALEKLLEMPHLSEIHVSNDRSTAFKDLYSKFKRKAILRDIKVILSKS